MLWFNIYSDIGKITHNRIKNKLIFVYLKKINAFDTIKITAHFTRCSTFLPVL